MTSLKKRSLGALVLAAGVALSAFTVASPAQAAEAPASRCAPHVWTDGTTIGFMCEKGASAESYQTVATCKNGQKVSGEVMSAPEMSYAYCSSVNSTVDSFDVLYT